MGGGVGGRQVRAVGQAEPARRLLLLDAGGGGGPAPGPHAWVGGGGVVLGPGPLEVVLQAGVQVSVVWWRRG